MSAEKLLHEAQYAFLCISYGDTRENRKNASRATALAKKIIRKYPTSSEARQANDLLISLGGEHYSAQFRHQHRSDDATAAKHDHSDLRKRRTEKQSLQDSSGESIAWSTLWNGVLGLKPNILFTLSAVAFMFVVFFGWSLPIMAFVLFAFVLPLGKRAPPEARVAANRAKFTLNEWLQRNQR